VAGERRLAGDTARQAKSPEVKEQRAEAAGLKEVLAELTLQNQLLKACGPPVCEMVHDAAVGSICSNVSSFTSSVRGQVGTNV
jgi:hypothetical protein